VAVAASSKPARDADRARSRRLFGAVLGGLARPQAGRAGGGGVAAASAAGAARRRADAEARGKRPVEAELDRAEEEHGAREGREEARRALNERREEESRAWQLESVSFAIPNDPLQARACSVAYFANVHECECNADSWLVCAADAPGT